MEFTQFIWELNGKRRRQIVVRSCAQTVTFCGVSVHQAVQVAVDTSQEFLLVHPQVVWLPIPNSPDKADLIWF